MPRDHAQSLSSQNEPQYVGEEAWQGSYVTMGTLAL